mgnify:CR=1 FL=1
MLRRLMLAALALCAFLALEGCGANRLAAPLADSSSARPVVTNAADGPVRDGDGSDGTISGSNSAGGVIEADSLTVNLDDAN